MTKELEALERIKKIEIYKEEDYYDPDDERTIGLSGYEYQGSVEEEYANEIDILETALIRLEKIDKLPKTEFYTTNKIELNNELDKKLKALEIIKKYYIFEENQFYPFKRKEIGVSETEEENDLLKEVLL